VAEETSDKSTEPTSVAEAPTEPTAAAEAPAARDAGSLSVESTAAPPSAWRRGVHVPVWSLGLLALLLVGLLGFGIGRWTAPDDGDEVSGVFQGQVEEGDGGPEVEPDFPLGERVVLGVTVEDSTDPDGAEVAQVLDSGPAGEAGIESGDVITAIDEEEVTDAPQLAEAIQDHESGDEVTITYERDGESDEVEVTLLSVSELRPSGPNDGSEGDSDAA
jgi:membrane-associated protease RseP (regulator of RpoE activity)